MPPSARRRSGCAPTTTASRRRSTRRSAIWSCSGRINATSVMVVAPSFDRSEAVALNVLNAGGAARRDRAACHADRAVPAAERRASRRSRDGAFLSLADDAGARLLRRLRSRARSTPRSRRSSRPFVACVRPRARFRRRPPARAAVPAGARGAARRSRAKARAARLGAAVRPRRSRSPQRSPIARRCCSIVLSQRFRARAAALGIATNPAFAGTYDFTRRRDFAALFPGFLDAAGGERGHVPSRACRCRLSGSIR